MRLLRAAYSYFYFTRDGAILPVDGLQKQIRVAKFMLEQITARTLVF